MDNDPVMPFFGMEPVFLAVECIAEPTADQDDSQETAQVHACESTYKATCQQATHQGANAPIDKFALKATVDKGLLKPLINWIPGSH
ncbi:hypothetical protein [Pedobacter sp. ASV28]|uniref:hypothetical protein n=1 Tax=Pedobacter sp. ASV28 TaxID=2795123 RepID=UPI0018EAC06A|nr:hypothetical protein [Pedobacter sp. ASV28]